MPVRSTFALVLILVSLAARADYQPAPRLLCERVFAEPAETARFPIKPTSGLTRRQVREVVASLDAVDQMVEGYLARPKLSAVEIERLGTSAGFDPQSFTMYLVYQRTFLEPEFGETAGTARSYAKHPNYYRAIDAHEYGHAYFHTNFQFPLGLNRKNAPHVFEAYNELFADVVAVLVTGNPQALKRAFHTVGYQPSEKIGYLRDFLRTELRTKTYYGYEPEWRNRLLDLHPEARSLSYYQALNDTRGYLWKYFLSQTNYQHRPGATLQKLLQIFEEELDYFQDRPFTYDFLNHSLIERIARELPEALVDLR